MKPEITPSTFVDEAYTWQYDSINPNWGEERQKWELLRIKA